jgi:CRISPR/Cas system-associated protein Csm6
MSKRINIAIEEDNWQLLDEMAAGERSLAVNLALREWAVRRKRVDAYRELDELRKVLPPASAAEIAEWIRQDRGRHG